VTVDRRGSEVDIAFVVPGGNTDGSTPADLNRVEVWALTAPPPVTPDDILLKGTRVGRVLVNPPPDPEAEEGKPAKPAPPRPPGGIDQAATAHLSEAFDPGGTVDPADVRSYVAVGFNNHGRRGAYSVVSAVPVGPPPDPPGKPEVSYDETTITVVWQPPDSIPDDVTLGYHVYEPADVPKRLTTAQLEDTAFEDKRIEWGAERCYVVRSVQTVEDLKLESEASPETCVKLVDTFPPAAPEGLTVVAAVGAMNLIWNPNAEADLAGYVLWRAIPAEGTLTAITPAPIKETTFLESVPAGTRVAYAVQAVDTAGNTSSLSPRVEETAR
jgi:hypothetical protein